jgi:hypothetical protein
LSAKLLYHNQKTAQKFFLFWQSKYTRQNLFKIAREANLTLAGKRITIPNSENLEQKPQTHWAAINAAHKKISENGKSWNPEHIYDCARTFFQNSV